MPTDPPPPPPRGTDAEPLAAAFEQQRAYLAAFVRRHSDAVIRARESCSDIVQSVCREVLANRHRVEFQGDEAFRAWLCSWALNKIRDRQRHWLAHKRDLRREVAPAAAGDASEADATPHFAHSDTPSREAMLHERIERIEAAFARLPAQYRDLLTLSRVAGLSHDEIAARRGSTPGAVRTQLHRALVRLTSELERLDGDESAAFP